MTAEYGLVGFPLGHSFSAGYFNAKFLELGLSESHSYRNFSVEQIADLKRILPPGIRGFNITIPHKKAVMELLSEIDPEAEAVGAVNCVKVLPDGRWKGYNTDVYGFEVSLHAFLNVLAGQLPRAAVLGTGGASRAVTHVLEKLGIDYVTVSRTGTTPRQVNYQTFNEALIGQTRLFINTTPLGMSPNLEHSPALDYSKIDSQSLLYDLVYNPAQTLFLAQGRAHGAWIKNGLQMLVLQAERSWEIWNS